jgi:hypothetical protein
MIESSLPHSPPSKQPLPKRWERNLLPRVKKTCEARGKRLLFWTFAHHFEGADRWSWKFDQFAAVLSYSFGFISGGNLQVRSLSTIGLVRRHDPM